MNIVQIGPYPINASLIKGGVEASVYGLANTLSKEHNVDVFDFPRLKGHDIVEKCNNLYVHRYVNKGIFNKDAINRANEIIRDVIALHPDVVHIHGTGEISSIIYKAIKSYGMKAILTVHGLLHVEKQNMLKSKFSLKGLYQYIHQTKIEMDVLENADRIIVDTEYVALKIVDLYKTEKLKKLPYIHVIPQGIDERYYNLENNHTQNIVLAVGSISKRKGHICLVKAFEKFCTEVKDNTCQLLIAGFVSEPKYYNILKKQIENSPYKDKINLLVNLTQDDLNNLYTRAKIFALHSQEESQGIVFAEAMAVGLPIVGTMVGGVPYVVKNKVNGYLSEYGNIDAFATHLKEILTNDIVFEKMKRCNKEEAAEYNWTLLTNRIISLYKQL